MKFEVVIAYDGKVIDTVKVENVFDIIMSSGAYFLRDERSRPIFTSPVEKTAYIKRIE